MSEGAVVDAKRWRRIKVRLLSNVLVAAKRRRISFDTSPTGVFEPIAKVTVKTKPGPDSVAVVVGWSMGYPLLPVELEMGVAPTARLNHIMVPQTKPVVLCSVCVLDVLSKTAGETRSAEKDVKETRPFVAKHTVVTHVRTHRKLFE